MKFMHAPQHVGEFVAHNLDSVRRLNPRSVGFTEMDPGAHSEIPQMRHVLKDYQVCTVANGDLGPHSQEVPIAVRTGPFCKVLGHKVTRISDKAGSTGLGNERYLATARIQRFGLKVAHLQTHLPAGIQDEKTGKMHANVRVPAAEHAVKAIMLELSALISEGYEVVLSGDWNWRDRGEPWEFSPLAVAAIHGMSHYDDGLDWMLWTPGLTGSVKSIPREKGLNKSDHPWLVGRLRRALLKRRKK